WHKARAQLRALQLLTETVKRLEDEPGVQRLLGEVRKKSIGSDGGDYLKRFLDARPSLRAHVDSDIGHRAAAAPDPA
ncbi:MAG TPA: hypothetical protein VEQ58_05040, partial [Polyangiaceae bacterium]|nr:hypothetical protein [Polyangiaceae bacterium]